MAARAPQTALIAIASLAIGMLLGSLLSGGGLAKDVAAASPGFTAQVLDAQPAAAVPLAPGLANAQSFEPRVSVASNAAAKELPEAPAVLHDGPHSEASSVLGSIVTLEGAPIAGVELELEPPKDAPKYRVRRATSDASGKFEFSGLPPGVWRVTGRHRDYALQRRNSFPQLVPTGTEVEFIASPAIQVDVRVTGEGANRARVAFRRADRGEPEWSVWTSSNTVLALSPGVWELCASVDALEDWPSDRDWKIAPLASPVTTVHAGGADAQVITLALESVRCLYGKVQLSSGYQGDEQNQSTPVVRLIETRTGTFADFDGGEGDRLSRGIEIDEQGRYGFFGLPFADWTVGVAVEGWVSPAAVQTVNVVGLTRLDLEDQAAGEGSVLVDAFTEGGHRITAGISFNFLHRDSDDKPNEGIWQGARVVLEADGALRVIAVPIYKEVREKAASKQELVLRATLPGFTQIEQTLPGLLGERLQLTFEAGADLEVELVGDGADRAMHQCSAALKNEEFQAQAEYDEDARALKFNGLKPGDYKLVVTTWGSDDSGSWRSVQLHNGEVVVHAGSQRMTVHMPTVSALVVRCPGVKKDTRANLWGPLLDPQADREENWWAPQANAKVDDSGQVRFESVMAGRYRLTIGQRMQLVTVPCPPVEFEGRIPERYRFRLAASDSPLRRAGVRSGDICVALDGEAFAVEGTRTRISALSSQSAGTLRLTVERAGRSLDLVLDASALKEDEAFDVYLEPVIE
jgi:hypothetical protein